MSWSLPVPGAAIALALVLSAATWAPASSSLPSSRPPSGPPGSLCDGSSPVPLVFGVIASAFVISESETGSAVLTCGWVGTPTCSGSTTAHARPLRPRRRWMVRARPGASREKWQWLSEPHNDFIFAIIGEELGPPGTLLILGVLRPARLRLLPPGAPLKGHVVRLPPREPWRIVAQAMVNISRHRPAPGHRVPLLVSSGGSS